MADYEFSYTENKTPQTEEEKRGTIILGIDFTDGHALMSNLDFKRISNPENLLQRILKFLHTEKNFKEIYEAVHNRQNTVFGFSIYETIGHTYTSVNLAKYKKEIKDYLLKQYDVIRVDTVNIIPVDDRIIIEIYLTSDYGEVEIKEVINDNFKLYGKGF